MSGDTLAEISQVRSGAFSDYHAPALLSFWRLAWLVIPGTWYVLVATVLLFVTATYAILRTAFAALAALLVTATITLSPMMLGYLGVLSRDTWFAALTLAQAPVHGCAASHPGWCRVVVFPRAILS